MQGLRKGRASAQRCNEGGRPHQYLNSRGKQNDLINRKTSQITKENAERIQKDIENISKIFYKKCFENEKKKFYRFTTDVDYLKSHEQIQQIDQKQKKGVVFNIGAINFEKNVSATKGSKQIGRKTLNLTYFATVNEKCQTELKEEKRIAIKEKTIAELAPIHRNSHQQLKRTTTTRAENPKLFLHRFLQRDKMVPTGPKDQQFQQSLAAYIREIREQCDYHNIEFNEFKSYPKQYLSYYIEAGNNERLVKDILSKRWWWEISFENSERSGANFLWTQIVRNHSNMEGTVALKRISKKANVEQIFARLKPICFFNHFSRNKYLTNNISLSYLMTHNGRMSCSYFPPTFYINQLNSQSWLRFTHFYFSLSRQEEDHYWMIKNAENKRNFNFFKIIRTFQQIKKFIEGNTKKDQSFIIQRYIARPMLYRNRKFDIQAYMLVTRLNGVTRGFWYKEGFINVSHEQYTTKSMHPFVHLVTDSIQINHKKFGDFENKLTFSHFEKYCNSLGKQKFSFEEKVIPIMKNTAKLLIQIGQNIVFSQTPQPTFQIFQLKFVLGTDLRPWMVSVNSNHSLSTTSPTLQAIYPPLIDDTFKLTLDLYFPPPTEWPLPKKFYMSTQRRKNGYELIYDQSLTDSQALSIKSIEDIEFWERVDEDVKVYEEIQGRRLSENEESSNRKSQVRIEIENLFETADYLDNY